MFRSSSTSAIVLLTRWIPQSILPGNVRGGASATQYGRFVAKRKDRHEAAALPPRSARNVASARLSRSHDDSTQNAPIQFPRRPAIAVAAGRSALGIEGRRLVRSRDRAVLGTSLDGHPYVSLVVTACEQDGTPLLMLS